MPTLPGSTFVLDCSNNQLASLPALPNTVRDLNCSNNQLTSLPALPLPIETLYCDGNPDLHCLPDLRQLEYLKFDSANILCLPNYGAIQTSIPSIANVPLCDAMNTHNCSALWNITGNAYKDDNSNCIRNAGETAISMLKVSLLQGSTLIEQTLTVTNGNYTFDTGIDTYAVTIDTTDIPFNVSCPLSGVDTAVLTAVDSFENSLDFALTCKPGFDVGAWSVLMHGRARPAEISMIDVHVGDYAYFWNQQYCNTTNVSGQVVITISGPATYTGAANGALTPVVTGNTLTYTISNWAAVNPNTDFRFSLQTDTTAQMGQQVCFAVNVTPVAGDNNPANNSLTHCFTVVSSYDPNDKLVSPVGGIDTSQKWLTYTVNFQNTGNAEAIHIYITDTLDSNIDESTFQLLAYSHQPMVQIKQKALRFNFANINLPDSNTNEPASHGYVQYKVKLKDNLTIGTTINNTAFIYFDFNAPVVTNTTSNTLIDPTVGAPSLSVTSFSVYPNPANSLLYINAGGLAIDVMRIFNLKGQLLLEVKQPGKAPVDISRFSAGIYIAEMTSSAGSVRKRWVKM
ncbi:MAG TPA: T9SS type A sorting domain-containing protein [Chitinophagales bacterium]|nr:T9SS type A sorting domain-containing protein [Chitinophagales bacterium]